MTTNTFYIGGKIRTHPSDFIVEEIWEDRICRVDYPILNRLKDLVSCRIQTKQKYLHFTLVKENWDTILALKYISGRTHCLLKHFGISGMKDKRALTSQRVSLWKGGMAHITSLKLPHMYLKDFEYRGKHITLGNAIGNQFVITIREVPKVKSEILDILTRFREEVTTNGVPNFFGPQRLGGGNAEVGKEIKNGNLKDAVGIILKKIQPYLKDVGFARIPRVFWYEKRMLQHLRKHPNDYAGALRKIPKRILRLYTHAYQSQYFNEKLEQAILKNRVPRVMVIPGFHVPKMPNLSTVPIERKSLLVAKDFKVLKVDDGIFRIEFTLGSGEYASTLLSHLVC